MKKYFSYIILFFWASISVAWAQNMHIKSQLDTNLIVIGDQTKLRVDVQYPTNEEVRWPLMQDTIVEGLEIVDLTIDTILTQKELKHFLLSYTITSFDSGYYVIPPQLLIDTKTSDTIESQALMFSVATLVLDTTKQNAIFDIKAPFEAPWSFSEFLSEYYPYILLAILLIILALVIFWYYKKQKNKETIPVKKTIPKEAAHTIAIRELNQLKDKKLWQNNRVKQYYVELSDIVRNYLENRFKIKALEQTSQEIFETIQRGKILSEQELLQLKQILSTADMAKFAKAKPLANENDLTLKNAFELIESTQLKEEKAVDKKEEFNTEQSSLALGKSNNEDIDQNTKEEKNA